MEELEPYKPNMSLGPIVEPGMVRAKLSSEKVAGQPQAKLDGRILAALTRALTVCGMGAKMSDPVFVKLNIEVLGDYVRENCGRLSLDEVELAFKKTATEWFDKDLPGYAANRWIAGLKRYADESRRVRITEQDRYIQELNALNAEEYSKPEYRVRPEETVAMLEAKVEALRKGPKPIARKVYNEEDHLKTVARLAVGMNEEELREAIEANETKGESKVAQVLRDELQRRATEKSGQ